MSFQGCNFVRRSFPATSSMSTTRSVPRLMSLRASRTSSTISLAYPSAISSFVIRVSRYTTPPSNGSSTTCSGTDSTKETMAGSMRTFCPSIPTEYSPRSRPALIFHASWERSRISIFFAQSLYAALTEFMWTWTSIFIPCQVSSGFDAPAGPREEVVLSVSREDPAFQQRWDLAHRGVFERPKGHAVRLRRIEDFPEEAPDPREFRGIAGPRFEPHAERVLDFLEDLDYVEGEDHGLFPAEGDGEVSLRAPDCKDEASLRLRARDSLSSVRERLVHERFHLVLEVRRADGLLGRQVGAALMGHEGPGGVEQERVVDGVAALRLDPDDRGVRRLVL